MKKLVLFFVCLCGIAAYGAPFYDDETPRPTAAQLGVYEVVDYSLFIPLREPFDFLDSASVRITFANPGDTALSAPVRLDFESMTCDSVVFTHPMLDIWELCDFRQTGDTLEIELPLAIPPGDTFFLTIYYHGAPVWGYFVQTNRYGDTVIYTLSWPSNARCWFPCVDHPADKATATIRVLAPESLRVASNGTEISADTTGGYVLHAWRSDFPLCTYNICFAAAKYDFWSDTSGSGIPFLYFAYPQDSARARFDWARTPEICDSFQTYYGDYPFAKYGMATTPFGLGGMEHQSMTFLGDGIVTGDRRYEAVVAHELSHSWFGNSVGLADWRDFWMNEGFAVFSEFLFTEIFEGEDAAAQYRRQTMNSYFSSGEDFPMYDPEVYLSYTCYNRAGMVLEMLRFMMGDSLFFAAVREYTRRFAYRTVTHDSFMQVFEEFWGDSLNWFFDQWVFYGGYPRFEYYYRCYPTDSGYIDVLHITQNNIYGGPEAYIMPLEVKLELSGGDMFDTVWIRCVDTEYVWLTSDSLRRIRIDPNSRALCRSVVVSGIEEFESLPSAVDIGVAPNPFNEVCRINVAGVRGAATVKIFDIYGRTIRMWRVKSSERQKVFLFDGAGLPSGVYFVRVSGGGFSSVRKIYLVR